MFNNIIFMGGIHGVGKSTTCQHICTHLNIQYLSASQLLRWKDLNANSNNKTVEDISYTQDRLISGLQNTIQHDKMYLLDGHYCLLNSNNEVVNIPLSIFKEINPLALNLILGDIKEIKNRLELRDNKPYEIKFLENLQKSELSHAIYLSKALKTPLNIDSSNDHSKILSSLSKVITLSTK